MPEAVQPDQQFGMEATDAATTEVYETPETPNREDVWSHDTCLVCQSKHSTPEEKEHHEKEDVHKSRTVVHDFFFKELSCLSPSSNESILYERYYRANTSVAGLDCISELNFSWSKSPFWACTICYTAGKTLESADDHLYSSYHKRNYISEYHPARFGELIRAQEQSTQDKFSKIEHDVILDILYEAKGLSPPDVYILPDRSRSWAFEMLSLKEEETESNYIVEPISDNHQIVACHICGESFLAYEKEELLQKAWNVHSSTDVHQRSTFMHSLLQEAKVRDVESLPAYCSTVSPLATDLSGFTKVFGAFYGKSCGFEFLVTFKDSNQSFCSICFCVLSNSDVTDHFASEYHIARCVKRSSPSKIFNSEYMSVDERQQILLEHLQDTESAIGHGIRHKTCGVPLPLLLKKLSFSDKRAFESIKVQETTIGSFRAAWCEDCKQYINLEVQEWQQHIYEDDHFENATKRILCYIDNNQLVSRSAAKTLPPLKKSTSMVRYTNGTTQGWYDKHSPTLGLTLVQDNCYFGLQYVVRDELNRQTTCLCCYFVCTYDQDDVMCLHVRCMDHISRAMHMINKELIGILWKYRDPNMKKILLWDYLTHWNLDSRNESVMVFDPVMACTANCFGVVPAKLIEIANVDPEFRQSNAETDNSRIPLNTAFRICNVEVKAVENEYVVLYCQECCQSFTSSFDEVNEKFAEHILSQSHFKRKLAFAENTFDENKRVAQISSSFDVNPIQQASDSKKLTWKWNETRNGFEFVYAQLGLSDISERRNSITERRTFKTITRDMFCRLCAEPIQASQVDLEQHIRSFTHIFYYVHKYRPEAIFDLETHLLDANADNLTKHRNIRRLFQRTLKGLENEKGQVSIFDFSLNDSCKLDEVKDVLEKEPEPMQIIDNGSQIQAPMAVYANKLESSNATEVQNFIQQVMKKSSVGFSGKEVTLDDAKNALLNEVNFSVLVDMSEKSPRKDDSSTTPATTSSSTVSVQESMPQMPEAAGPLAEPGSDVTSRRSKSRSQSRSRSSRSSSRSRRGLSSRSPSRFMFDESNRAGRWARSGSRTRTRRSKSALRTRSRRSESRSRERSPLPARQIPRRSKTVMKPRLERRNERSRSTSKTRSRRSKSRSRERSPLPARPIPRRSKTVMKLRSDTQNERLWSPSSSTCNQIHDMPSKFGTSELSDWATFKSYHARTSELKQNANIPPSVARPIPRRSKTVMKPRDVSFAFDRPAVPNSNRPERFQLPFTRKCKSPESTPGPVGLQRNPYKSKDTDSYAKDQDRAYSPLHWSHRMGMPKSPPRYLSERLQKNSNGRKRTRYRSRSRRRDKTGRSEHDDRKRMRKSRSRSRRTSSRSRSSSQTSSSRHRDRSRDRSRRKSRSRSDSGSRSMSGCDRNRSDSRSSDKVFATSNPNLERNLMNRLNKRSKTNKIQINLSSNSLKGLEKDESQPYKIRNAPDLTRMGKGESVIAKDLKATVSIFDRQTTTRMSKDKNKAVLPADIPPPTIILPSLANPVLNSGLVPNPIVLMGTDSSKGSEPSPAETFRQRFFKQTGIDIMAHVTTATGETMTGQPVTYSPFGGPPKMPFGIPFGMNVHPPSTPIGFPAPPPIQMPIVVVTAEVVMRTKMELYKKDLTEIKNVADLREYLWRQGYDKIPPQNSPLFNEVVKKCRGTLGASTLYQVICYGHPELETYYCGICKHWTTVSEMFLHLKAPIHRLNYLSLNYKFCHNKAVNEPDKAVRDVLLDKFANKIWDKEGSGECSHMMRCILNQEVIARLWPKYKDFVDNSWKIMDFDDDEPRSYDTQFSQARSPSQSAERDSLRYGQPEKSTKYPGKMDSWDESAASFLYKIGDREGALKLFASSNRHQESRLQAQESKYRDKESGTHDQENEPLSASEEGECSIGTSDDDSLPSKKTSIQPKAVPSTSMEDRLRSMAPRDSLGAQEKSQLLAELDKPIQPAAARLEDTAPTAMPQRTVSRFAARYAAQAQAMDEATKQRKAVGAMVQLRSMADDAGGMVSNETFFMICEEMGLPAEEVFTNQHLQQFISYFTAIVDVRSAYQQYLVYKVSRLAPPPIPPVLPPQPVQAPVLTTQQIMDILNKIDIGEQSQPPGVIPEEPGLRPTGEYAEPELSEEGEI